MEARTSDSDEESQCADDDKSVLTNDTNTPATPRTASEKHSREANFVHDIHEFCARTIQEFGCVRGSAMLACLFMCVLCTSATLFYVTLLFTNAACVLVSDENNAPAFVAVPATFIAGVVVVVAYVVSLPFRFTWNVAMATLAWIAGTDTGADAAAAFLEWARSLF